MKCERGCFARVISASQNPEFLGYVVQCIEPFVAHRGEAWVVAPQLGDFNGVYDWALEPLKKPGEHEVDQMVALMRKPVYAGVAA